MRSQQARPPRTIRARPSVTGGSSAKDHLLTTYMPPQMAAASRGKRAWTLKARAAGGGRAGGRAVRGGRGEGPLPHDVHAAPEGGGQQGEEGVAPEGAGGGGGRGRGTGRHGR